eukprot:1145834-Pelagomonas_calceolata.AAC.3
MKATLPPRYTFGEMAPSSTRYGTSAASHGAKPKHNACAMPKRGLQIKKVQGRLKHVREMKE